MSRISINPNICFGKPCIRGHRIWVALILDLLAGGATIEELLEEYSVFPPREVQIQLVITAPAGIHS